MFNNIIGQKEIVDLLKIDISKSNLNNSILLHGSRSTGKLTTALELTRILNCLEYRENDCQCNNCQRINELDFEGLLFLSRRNVKNIINELINSYKKYNEQKYLNQIKYTFKLLSLPLQDFLIKNSFTESDKNIIYRNIEKAYDIFSNDNILPEDLEPINNIIDNINKNYKRMNIPVDMIRSMLDWTYISQPDIKRVVIIDHVDLLESSSQNILLKRLEEPSSNLYFILIAEKKNKVLQTILSRCRTFYFKDLNKEDCNSIIANYFGEKSNHSSLLDYLSRNDETAKENIYPILIKLLNLLFLKEAPFADLSLLLSSYKDRGFIKALLYEFGQIIEKEIFNRSLESGEEPEYKMLENISFYDLTLIKELITEKYNMIDIYSLNPVLLMEGIFYPLKVMIQNDKI